MGCANSTETVEPPSTGQNGVPAYQKSLSDQKVPVGNGDSDIAVIGLAVMGQNLILNMNDHGFKVTAFNRSTAKVDDFLANEAKGTKVVGAHSVQEMMATLKSPRRIMLLVKAGSAVDDFIKQIAVYASPGDIIIDGGNSNFGDSIRRTKEVEAMGLRFVGSGVSGGEEGARHGPSLMPGGTASAWPYLKPIFQSITAKAGDGQPCCEWVGNDGSGHYVKMVHNGIEYGDMQLICEAYQLMKVGLGMSCEEMAKVFSEWNAGELDSFLIEITANILKFKDTDGAPLVEKIRDTAGQKGTGKWTGIESLELGVPVTLIGESVYARCLSALKDERVTASSKLMGPPNPKLSNSWTKNDFVEAIRQALFASKIVSYAQGFMLLREAAKANGWALNYGEIAMMWRGGCIIRSGFLGKVDEAFKKEPGLTNLLLAPHFMQIMNANQARWRRVVAEAALLGVPTPTFSTALAFYDGYRSARLPANLLQAQRDYFGAHTFERLDKPGVFEHADWAGTGGRVASTTYNA